MKKRQFSALEAKTIKALVEIVGNGSYVLSTKDCLKEILVEKEVLKSRKLMLYLITYQRKVYCLPQKICLIL